MIDFEPFPKIARFSRDVVVTEKIDGTNAQVNIGLIRPDRRETLPEFAWYVEHEGNTYAMSVASRTRLIFPSDLSGKKDSDNYGFAQWAYENRNELVKLGPGRHFGEWWGRGIQRGYGLNERRFSLFNVGRWTALNDEGNAYLKTAPEVCDVVPILYSGPMDQGAINATMTLLGSRGSFAAPGFSNPEGIVIYHTAANVLFKKTFEKDDVGKERVAKAA